MFLSKNDFCTPYYGYVFIKLKEDILTKTYICDVMPGGGKSSAIIKMMNESPDKKFIYIAPYRDEDKRIIEACKDRGFVTPVPKDSGGRLANLHTLLSQGVNVASTHALFETYNSETIELIRDGGYTLIMDEAFQIAKILSYSASDIETMIAAGLIDIKDSVVTWTGDSYSGGVFSNLRVMAEDGYLQSFRNMFFYWYYPPEVFKAFDEVYVLTYMFDYQFLKYYFDINHIAYENRWVDKINGEYVIVDYPVVPEHAYGLKDKIHILDNPKLNAVGETRNAMSSTWYEKAPRGKNGPIAKIKKNIANYFRHYAKKKADDVMWTSYLSGQKDVEGRGFGEFVPFNARATNKYREKDTIAYVVNVFPNPNFVSFFRSYGCDVNGDGYALSEMIQLIWRSAIREGKDIWVYIPSKRMRGLLTKWLDELAEGKIQGEK